MRRAAPRPPGSPRIVHGGRHWPSDAPATPPGPERESFDVPGLIRRVRRRADLSQAELASRLGVAQSTIARWEGGRGEPGAFVFAQLVSLAGLRVAVLDDHGMQVGPLHSAGPRDAADRRYPAHLDVLDAVDPYSAEPIVRVPLRQLRDAWRGLLHGTPDDHPTVEELAAVRAARRARARNRVSQAQARIRERRAEEERAPGGDDLDAYDDLDDADGPGDPNRPGQPDGLGDPNRSGHPDGLGGPNGRGEREGWGDLDVW